MIVQRDKEEELHTTLQATPSIPTDSINTPPENQSTSPSETRVAREVLIESGPDAGEDSSTKAFVLPKVLKTTPHKPHGVGGRKRQDIFQTMRDEVKKISSELESGESPFIDIINEAEEEQKKEQKQHESDSTDNSMKPNALPEVLQTTPPTNTNPGQNFTKEASKEAGPIVQQEREVILEKEQYLQQKQQRQHVVITDHDKTLPFGASNMQQQTTTTPVQQVPSKTEVNATYETSHDITLTQEKSWTKQFFEDFKNLIADRIKKNIQELFESVKKALGLKRKPDEASHKSESPVHKINDSTVSNNGRPPPSLIRGTNTTDQNWTRRMVKEMTGNPPERQH